MLRRTLTTSGVGGGGAGGGVSCCCVMCAHKWRDCVGAGAVQLIAVLHLCSNSLLRPTDCVCVCICSSLTLIRGSLMSRPVHSSVTHMTTVAGAVCPYLLVARGEVFYFCTSGVLGQWEMRCHGVTSLKELVCVCVYSPQLVWSLSDAPHKHLFIFVLMGHRDV